ncbi:MAG TPA: ATP-binding protein [Pilimelia sp.]|nr:ATP-binding protein [Pilimelia sp.]
MAAPAPRERGRIEPAWLDPPGGLTAVEEALLAVSSSSFDVDRLALLAAGTARAPMAAVVFLGPREARLATAHGMDPDWHAEHRARLEATWRRAGGGGPVAEPGPPAILAATVYATDRAPVGVVSALDPGGRHWTAAEADGVRAAAELVSQLLLDEESARRSMVSAAEAESVLDNAVDAFVAVDGDGRVVLFNEAAESAFGWSRAEILGRSAEELVPARLRAASRRERAALADPADARRGRARITSVALRRDGTEFPVEVGVRALRGEWGLRFQAFVQDIGARVAAERAANRHARFLDAVLDNLDTSVVACDGEGRLALFNRAARRLHGVEPDLSTGETWATRHRLAHPDGRIMAPEEVPLTRAFNGERLRDAEVLITTPTGRARTVLTTGQVIIGPDGEKLGAVAVQRDVTDERRTDRFARCELAVARALATAASSREAEVDVLAAIGTTLGWAHAELWLVDATGEALRLAACWTAPGRQAVPAPSRLTRGHGLAGTAWGTAEPAWIPALGGPDSPMPGGAVLAAGLRTAVAVPMRGAGTALGVLVLFTDQPEDPHHLLTTLLSGVATQVGHFLEHRRAEELAVQLARTKDEFLGLVGHELRTPLTSISSYTELLRADPRIAGTDVAELVAVLDRNAAILRGIIDDLLDLTGLESGHIEIRPQPVDAAAIVRDAVAAAGVVAQRLTAEVPPEIVVPADPTRLRQVIDNLVGNALKFSPPDTPVRVHLRRDGDAVALDVIDHGIGIPAEERHLLFRRFYRSSAVRHHGIPGSGLGLTLCRIIVERHGGTITARDTIPGGAGTTVTVRLPASLTAPP